MGNRDQKLNNLADLGILITRPQGQGETFKKSLMACGARVYEYPAIEIRPLQDPVHRNALEQALKELGSYRWLLFTSVNGVECLWQAAIRLGFSTKNFAHLKIGVIGPKTQKKVEGFGLNVTLCPSNYKAEGLLNGLFDLDKAALKNGAKVLLPRAREARAILPEELKRCGAIVDLIPVYETIASSVAISEILTHLKNKKVNCITFTSSSTVKFFFEKMENHNAMALLKNLTFACIGPITAEKLKEKGFDAHVVPQDYTSEGLANALSDYFKDKNV